MPNNPEIRKGIAIFDTHVGTSTIFTGGRYRKVKTHNESAIRAMFNFAEDFRPDVFIHGGDLWDFFPISHWNKERAAEVSRTSFRNDIEMGNRLILDRIDSLEPQSKVFITGNHEAWLDQFLAKYPQLTEYLNLSTLAGFDRRGYKVVEQGHFHNEGKLYFAHGDTIANGKYHSNTAVTDYMRNVVYGHRHSFQSFPRTNPLDANDTKIGWSIPGLCNLSPTYSKRQANVWMHGFCYFYLLPDGTFSIYPVIMHRHRFVANGKLYTP